MSEAKAITSNPETSAAPAMGSELRHGTGEAVERRQEGFISQILPGLCREGGMDTRRLGMGDGIAENGITVGHSQG